MDAKRFAGCWSKLGRAQEHFDTLKAELTAWHDSSPYSVRKERNSDGSRHSLILVGDSTKQLERWSLICGDCAHNIRSALDHLIYALAIQHSGKNSPPNERNLQFPICGSRTHFDTKGNWIAPLTDAARAFIERVQPYNRLDPLNPSTLGILADFDNSDKHRLLNVTLGMARTVEIKFTPICGVSIDTHMRPIVKDGAEIAYLTVDPPQLEVDYKFVGVIDVAVSHVPIGPYESGVSQLLTVLHLMIAEASSIVGEGIEFP
jgi:hypothetical protein